MQLVFHQANLYTQLHEFYIDLAGFNTANMFVGADLINYLFFKTCPFGQYRIAENYKGLVDVVYRAYPETARNLETEFEGEDLPGDVKKALADDRYEEKFQIVHAVKDFFFLRF